MASSSAGLARTKSLRRPTVTNSGGELGQRDATAAAAAPPAARPCASPSRLPVKPPTSSSSAASSRAAAGATAALLSAAATSNMGVPRTTAAAGAANKGSSSNTSSSSKPMSGVFGRITSVRRSAAREAAGGNNDASEPTKSARPSTSSSTRTTRPTTSAGIPSATSSSSRPPRAAAHARTRSSATTLTSATVLRPPSQGSTTTSSSTASAGTAAGSRAPANSTVQSKMTTGTTLHRRQPSSSAAVAAASAGDRSSASIPPVPHLLPPQQQQQHRPAFTTLQQHYSPAKSLAPKPLTSTFLAPPSPSKRPANVALSAETARLQAELLQLHLLHRGAPQTRSAWRASARRRLGERFARLALEDEEVGRAEAAHAERVNVAALRAWAAAARKSGGGASLEERIQTLDAVVTGVWGLGEPGGRYARVAKRFERWAQRMVEAVEARRAAEARILARDDGEQGPGAGLGSGQEDELLFVEELDAAWREDCAHLARRLDGWRRQLREIEMNGGAVDGMAAATPEQAAETKRGDGEDAADGADPLAESSLARVLAGCRSLVHDMLGELSLMEQIEREALRDEDAWVRRMNRTGDGEGGSGSGRAAPRAGAIWRVL